MDGGNVSGKQLTPTPHHSTRITRPPYLGSTRPLQRSSTKRLHMLSTTRLHMPSTTRLHMPSIMRLFTLSTNSSLRSPQAAPHVPHKRPLTLSTSDSSCSRQAAPHALHKRLFTFSASGSSRSPQAAPQTLYNGSTRSPQVSPLTWRVISRLHATPLHTKRLQSPSTKPLPKPLSTHCPARPRQPHLHSLLAATQPAA